MNELKLYQDRLHGCLASLPAILDLDNDPPYEEVRLFKPGSYCC